MISASAAMTGSYDYLQVVLSVVIAISASYAALDLGGRVTAASGWVRRAWLIGGATAMGFGIWSMHFTGMLAFRLPVLVSYSWPTVLLSLLVAISASAFALYVVSRHELGMVRALAGSVIMGSGIAAMHYIGMAAMRLAAVFRFHPLLVTLSVAFAIAFSFAALILVFDLREETKGTPSRKIASAVVMGAAVSAMHYTGMASASFMPSTVAPGLSHAASVSSLGNAGIVIVTLIVLVTVVLTSAVDRRLASQRAELERGRELATINEELRKEMLERQRAEDALRRSEDQLRLVIDTIPALVWSASPDGSLDFLNQRWLEYTGISSERGLGWAWAEELHPEDREGFVNAWRSAVATGEPFEHDVRVRRADGEYRWFSKRAVPLRGELGHIVKWYGTTTDIEDRKRAECALQEAQAGLSHVTRVTTMGELAAAIAHEVNQPLAAIVTNANFCLRQLANATPNSDKLREAILEIVNDGTRASAVISRIRALLQKSPPERVAVNVNQIIQEVTILLRNEMTRNRVSLRTDLAADLPRVSGDPVQLQQVLINLVMNSIDAMRSLAHRPRELLIKSARNHNEVSIQVQDSGAGLDPERAEHIFEPFFTTKPEGIGMGLSISRSIVESHGGRLWAESDSKGAMFQFTLPTK